MDNFPAQASNASSDNSMVFSEKDEKVKKTKNLVKKFFLIILAIVVILSTMLLVWFLLNKFVFVDKPQKQNQEKTALLTKKEFIDKGGLEKKEPFLFMRGEITEIEENILTVKGGNQALSAELPEKIVYMEQVFYPFKEGFDNVDQSFQRDRLLSKLKKGDLVSIQVLDNTKTIIQLTLYFIKLN